MARERPLLHAFTADGPILVAMFEVLADLYDMIEGRLPPAGSGKPETDATKPMPVKEPAPDRPPVVAEPVQEPAPHESPEVEGEDVEPSRLAPPPRAGRGSGLDAWQAFASIAGVGFAADASRNDIIAACVAAGVIPAD